MMKKVYAGRMYEREDEMQTISNFPAYYQENGLRKKVEKWQAECFSSSCGSRLRKERE